MGGYFTLGERKERPGVYKRYENAGNDTTGVEEKIAAAVVTGNWGPLNTPIHVDSGVDVKPIIGTGTGATVLNEIFADGPSEAIVVRCGNGGTKGTATLSDTASPAAAVIDIETKYVGNREFSIGIKPALDDETVKQATIYEGTAILETRTITPSGSETEVDAFVTAFADSKYINVTKRAAGNGTLANVSQTAFTPGTNPTVTTEDYAAGFAAIEPEVFHYICVDTNNTAVHALLTAFVDRIHQDGAYARAVVGEPHTIALATRMANAAAYNDEKVCYVLNSGTETDGTVMEGYIAAARACGVLAATPSSESVTHRVMKGVSTLYESLTNSEIKKALKSGCLVFTLNKNNQVMIEKGINTLVTPRTNQDAGWKKIKRTDIRFELLDRVEKITEPMIGKVNNDANGRAAIIAAAQRVIDAMIGEGKLLSGNCLLDNTQPPEGDSAWFKLAVDDIDSLETVYLTFRFRFSQAA